MPRAESFEGKKKTSVREHERKTKSGKKTTVRKHDRKVDGGLDKYKSFRILNGKKTELDVFSPLERESEEKFQAEMIQAEKDFYEGELSQSEFEEGLKVLGYQEGDYDDANFDERMLMEMQLRKLIGKGQSPDFEKYKQDVMVANIMMDSWYQNKYEDRTPEQLLMLVDLAHETKESLGDTGLDNFSYSVPMNEHLDSVKEGLAELRNRKIMSKLKKPDYDDDDYL